MQSFKHRALTRTGAVLAALALVALVGGCARTAQESSTTSGSAGVVSPSMGVPDGSARGEAVAPSATPSKDSAGTSATSIVDKLVVVNKTLRIETADVDTALSKIRDLATRDKADITSMQVATSVDTPVYPLAADSSSSYRTTSSSVPLRAYVTVRVPADTYQAFIADAAKLGKVLFQSESSDDVTQQHVDMQARLGNLKAEQARLRQLFDKANKVSDMLAIEQELTRVQGDIESMQAQITYLERQAAMATVTIELTEPTPLVSPAGGTEWGVQKAFTDAIRAFVSTMNSLIVILGPVLALLVFVGLPVWLIVWLVRRSTKRHPRMRGPVPPTPVGPPATGADNGPAA